MSEQERDGFGADSIVLRGIGVGRKGVEKTMKCLNSSELKVPIPISNI